MCKFIGFKTPFCLDKLKQDFARHPNAMGNGEVVGCNFLLFGLNKFREQFKNGAVNHHELSSQGRHQTAPYERIILYVGRVALFNPPLFVLDDQIIDQFNLDETLGGVVNPHVLRSQGMLQSAPNERKSYYVRRDPVPALKRSGMG